MVDAPRDGPKPKLDVVGGALSALGLGAIVLGVLQSSTWGLVEPKDSPVAPLGFSLAIWLIGAGVALLYAFVRWQRHRESSGQDPLVHLDLMAIPPLRSGLASLLTQNLILMGIFFVVPLYLQLVLGLDALETGVKMLPGLDHDVRHIGTRLAARPALLGAHDHPRRSHHERDRRSW